LGEREEKEGEKGRGDFFLLPVLLLCGKWKKKGEKEEILFPSIFPIHRKGRRKKKKKREEGTFRLRADKRDGVSALERKKGGKEKGKKGGSAISIL